MQRWNARGQSGAALAKNAQIVVVRWNGELALGTGRNVWEVFAGFRSFLL